ncbi:peroxiredoxin-like family protein [Thalassobaculum sp.]|uniref:peroxiredoxin-like family protein n=1 Tax=Thalassobaculum sp. TaxID=2022740 RepID=UPI0032EAB7F7
MSETGDPRGTLAERLEANTIERRKRLADSDWKTIDGSIRALDASGVRANVLQPGRTAPDFALPNADGEIVRSTELRSRGPLVVKFYRGSWCSYCNVEVRALMEVLGEIRALGGDMVAITPELPDEAAKMTAKHGLAFEVLSDVGNRVARQYGLVWTLPDRVRDFYGRIGLDLERSNGDDSWELPIPGNFVVAPDGTLLDVFADPDYRVRQEPAEVVGAIRRWAGR